MKVVTEYNKGEGSFINLGIKYDIISELLRSWVRVHNTNQTKKSVIKLMRR